MLDLQRLTDHLSRPLVDDHFVSSFGFEIALQYIICYDQLAHLRNVFFPVLCSMKKDRVLKKRNKSRKKDAVPHRESSSGKSWRHSTVLPESYPCCTLRRIQATVGEVSKTMFPLVLLVETQILWFLLANKPTMCRNIPQLYIYIYIGWHIFTHHYLCLPSPKWLDDVQMDGAEKQLL